MRPALDVFWESARDWYNGMVGLVTMNAIGFFCESYGCAAAACCPLPFLQPVLSGYSATGL